MAGVAPLSYTTIKHWSELKNITLKSYEVDALVYIDSAMLNPGEPEQK